MPIPSEARDREPIALSADSSPRKTRRLLSVDALRGFDMFWIIGGDRLAISVLAAGGWTWSAQLQAQFEHAEWDGFRFYDLIFPLFLFLVGCVLPFSLEKYRGNAAAAHGRIVRRTLLIVLLGLIHNGLLDFDWPSMSYAGVLQRIGICYGLAALFLLHARWKARVLVVVAILLGYWAILAWLPFPGGIAGDMTKEGNVAGYLDRNYLPGKIQDAYYGFGANEGLLSTLPAIATALLGVFAGEWLRTARNPWQKVLGLGLAGIVLVVTGYCWGSVFPIIKNLWTSSFVAVAAGWSLLLLTLFYALIDVLGWRKWAFFCVVIGMNAITIYLAVEIVDFEKISRFFLGGVSNMLGAWQEPLILAGTVLVEWLLLWSLYRSGKFLRV